jgi:hypothetical protein
MALQRRRGPGIECPIRWTGDQHDQLCRAGCFTEDHDIVRC